MKHVLSAAAFTVLVAACGGTSESAPAAGAIEFDQTITVSPLDRVFRAFGEHIWAGTGDGEAIQLRLHYLNGEESATTVILEMQQLDGDPTLVTGSVRDVWWDGEDHESTEFIEPSDVTLRHWDPQSVIAGQIQLGTSVPLPFWVDLTQPAVEVPGQTSQVEVAPGGVIQYGCCDVLQFLEVLEDSRCPADVTCVWEGQVRVSLHHHSRDQTLELSLPGDPVVYIESAVGVPERTVQLTDATAGADPIITLTFTDS